MAVSKHIETRDHITGFREEVGRAAQTASDSFFTWFDEAENTEASFQRGENDFHRYILQPANGIIPQARQRMILEIGHGGGRLLAAASPHFQHCYGVDIHDQNALVLQELRRRGFANIELFQTDGHTLPFNNNQIDVVYSFIVLQHVEKIDIFKNYLSEAFRVLQPGGLAVLYFGRRPFFSLKKRLPLLFWIDKILEKILVPSGFREFPARVNSTNLVLTLGYGKKLARDSGFYVMKSVCSYKNFEKKTYGGQHGLLLKKPE